MPKRKASKASQAVIENCEARFSFRCPRQWTELAPTSDERVRYCGTCEKNVYYCETREEVDQCAREGKCAAVDYGTEFVVGNLEKLY